MCGSGDGRRRRRARGRGGEGLEGKCDLTAPIVCSRATSRSDGLCDSFLSHFLSLSLSHSLTLSLSLSLSLSFSLSLSSLSLSLSSLLLSFSHVSLSTPQIRFFHVVKNRIEWTNIIRNYTALEVIAISGKYPNLPMFRIAFNTLFCPGLSLSFTKGELDAVFHHMEESDLRSGERNVRK